MIYNIKKIIRRYLMDKYVYLEYGYVYEQAIGDPNGKIALGTSLPIFHTIGFVQYVELENQNFKNTRPFYNLKLKEKIDIFYL